MKKKIINYSLASVGLIFLAGLLVSCVAGRGAYETATYTAEKKAANVEIRTYPALKVVSTSSAGAKDGQFMQLFRYISGENSNKEKISMTTPVFMDKSEGQNRMSFVLPAEVAKKAIPKPTNERVSLNSLPARKMAVLRFAGGQSAENEKVHEAKLRAWLSTNGITPTGDAIFAYYDPPFTPPPMRRNEVMLAVP